MGLMKCFTFPRIEVITRCSPLKSDRHVIEFHGDDFQVDYATWRIRIYSTDSFIRLQWVKDVII